jgi:methionyl-tRNA formyltransferase
MKKTSETVVFFGSGPVAAQSLELLAKNFAVEAVVTKPKPTHHKGSFPVIDVADKLGLPVHTVTDKKSLDQLIAEQPFASKVGVLIDFGIIVSQEVIDYFPLGIVNSHFSLLPEWRGADPITFAVLSGQEQTGVSLMLLVEKMDEGPLLAYGEYDMPADITTPALTSELIDLSDVLLGNVLAGYIEGSILPSSQDITGRSVSYSKKLTKSDGEINWDKPATQLEREIRAYLGWPGSFTTLAGKKVTITKAQIIDTKGKPGQVLIQDKQLIVCCGEQALVIDRLKPEGKSEMSGWSFVAGHKDKLI